MSRLAPIFCTLLLAIALCASAAEGPTAELGATLFTATTLGSNGKSCASCHPAGKGLGELAAYYDGQLKEMINFCIRDALKGKMLNPQAQELDALLAYLRTFGKQ
ncbi:hypothetical protein JCM30471_05930 [Desulfuromonas carbonis]|uniref:hypothetical protein n=1 Tax=Desulfuromonas sp. DDH964 TaxID=1823759 RepID=UPI00078D301F|nr:hypothetical protein [Desulfuromonas sp. DDH964]AMV72093.1 cytochrome c, 1 heme-binding site [Desulfuromonas sp. DDH964]